mmetsp:Transcript_310/g.449  ORF Transcript_310/g.449 Transcript_310/m.449 type:complete len:598 (+) Transcript_310:130-1923(+)
MAKLKNNNMLLFVSLAVFRVLNALLLQTQFDPDEYWQTLEPAYCEAFDGNCAYTWEWTRRASTSSWFDQIFHGPVRSYLSIVPTYLFYKVVQNVEWLHTPFWVSKGPLLCNAVLVAAVTDYCIWYIVANNSFSHSTVKDSTCLTQAWWALFCSITSWFQAYTLVRTYSNSLETLMLVLGIALLSDLRSSGLAGPKIAFILGGMSVAIRFTALAAWVPLGILWALYSQSNGTSIQKLFHRLLNPCASYGLVGLLFSMVVDRYFYNFWTLPVLGNLHFNVIEGLGSLYGTHPTHWYLTAGIPVMTGLLLPFLIVAAVTDLIRRQHTKNHLRNTCWIVILSYLTLHSASSHKEFRFLLPLLPLMCIIAGPLLADQLDITKFPRRKVLSASTIFLFIAVNLLAFLYLGVLHQRAPLDVNKSIVRQLQQEERISNITNVHYLMGCHSTPLYSHLHVPGIRVEAWYLDCSPTCRSSTILLCESEQFSIDPVSFIENAYEAQLHPSNSKRIESSTCVRTGPDFVVLFSEDAMKIRNQLQSMGLVEVRRFFHNIGGVSILNKDSGDDFSNPAYSRFKVANWLEFSFHEMVLYAQQIESDREEGKS